MHPDRGHMARLVGIEIEYDGAAAQRRARRNAVARRLQRWEIGSRDRQRQYVAIIERSAHFGAAAGAPSDPAARASARRSAITLLSAPLVALSAG